MNLSINWSKLSARSPEEIKKAILEATNSLSISDRNKSADKILKAIYENSLLAFAHALGYKRVDWETHRDIIAVLESNSRRKLIVVPRGCFKSTLASVVYPIWRHLKDPNLRIIIDSELLTNSSKFLREIEAHLLGDTITRLYGNMRDKERTWNSTEIITNLRTDHSKKEASFTASGIGSNRTGNHFDLACLDDLSSAKTCSTAEQQQKVIDHYRFFTSILDPEYGELIVTATRYHENDLVGFIIENELDEGQRKALGF